MIRPKQTKAKSVPDNEVRLTFWGGEAVQTRHGPVRQMHKHPSAILQRWLFRVWVIRRMRATQERRERTLLPGILHVASRHTHAAL